MLNLHRIMSFFKSERIQIRSKCKKLSKARRQNRKNSREKDSNFNSPIDKRIRLNKVFKNNKIKQVIRILN